ncbi:MAG: histone deacetylase [Polyangiaceae bacterium]|nr:histone deacetylase [Polyangiaceae bacterium]
MATALPVVLLDDELFDKHVAPSAHPERPERLHAARQAMAAFDVDPLRVIDATAEELGLVHTCTYLDELDHLADRRGFLDADTFHSEHSVAAARRAAGASVQLVRHLRCNREAKLGVALVRPPGHHALPDRAMGFCLLNNAAVSAAVALTEGANRIAILDIDVHHGNGTEQIFYSDPRVLYVSLHEWPQYPGTGRASDVGEGRGLGFNLNVPLTQGAGDEVYATAFEELVVPVLRQFDADAWIISAGFDAHRLDPLGGMELGRAGYFEMGRTLASAAPPETPIAVLLEGGYDLQGIQEGLEALLGGLGAPLAHGASGGPRAKKPSSTPLLGEAHRQDLERAKAQARRFWKV